MKKKKKIDDKDSTDKDGSNKNIIYSVIIGLLVFIGAVSIWVFIYKIEFLWSIWDSIKSIFGKVKNSISSKSSGSSGSFESTTVKTAGRTNGATTNATNAGNGAVTNAGRTNGATSGVANRVPTNAVNSATTGSVSGTNPVKSETPIALQLLSPP